jgi:alpha-1,2-mannosyltransferase
MVDSGGMAAPADRWSLVALAISIVGLLHLWIAVPALYYSDFVMFHATAQALMHGRPAYEPHVLVDGLWWNMNPPQFHLLTIPLAWLTLPAAAQLFRVVNAIALIASVLLLFTFEELRSRKGGWIVAAAVTCPGLVMELGAGQVAGLLAVLVTVAWKAIGGSRWLVAGTLIGATCALKPIFLPVVAWLLFARQWKALAAAAGVAAALVGTSVAIWGWDPQADWLRAIGAVTWFDSRFNASWPGLAQRFLSGTYILPYRTIATVSAVLSVLAAVWASRLEPGEGLTKCLVASVAVAPLGWVYYLPVAGPLLMRRAYDGGRWPITAWLLWVPLPFVPQVDAPFLVRTTLSSAYAWGMLALSLAPGTRRPARIGRDEA